jgi:hypothetical protein
MLTAELLDCDLGALDGVGGLTGAWEDVAGEAATEARALSALKRRCARPDRSAVEMLGPSSIDATSSGGKSGPASTSGPLSAGSSKSKPADCPGADASTWVVIVAVTCPPAGIGGSVRLLELWKSFPPSNVTGAAEVAQSPAFRIVRGSSTLRFGIGSTLWGKPDPLVISKSLQSVAATVPPRSQASADVRPAPVAVAHTFCPAVAATASVDSRTPDEFVGPLTALWKDSPSSV